MQFSVQEREEFLITIELKIDLEQQKVKQAEAYVCGSGQYGKPEKIS